MTAKELAIELEPYITRAGFAMHLWPCNAVSFHQIEGHYQAYIPPDYKVKTPCSCGFDDLINKAMEE
jgi:hypothetical protein